MKLALVFSVLCVGHVLSTSESSCGSAISTCGSEHPAAASTGVCSEKKPFFDCVLSNGCEESHSNYIVQVNSKSYGECNGSGSLIMGWTLPLLLVISAKCVTL